MYTYEKSRFKSIVRIDPNQLDWLKENKGDLKTVAGFLDLIINAYKEMKWYNLKNNKCPKCSSVLTGEENSLILNCSKPDCDFKIGTKKFAELSNTCAQKYSRQDKFDDSSGWSRFQD